MQDKKEEKTMKLVSAKNGKFEFKNVKKGSGNNAKN